MTATEVIAWLRVCSPTEREQVFAALRPHVGLHPLEQTLNTRAEVILEAIQRAGGLTLRMIRGVIAEAAFDVEVAAKLPGWQRLPVASGASYDVHLRDGVGEVRVQVKLQRSRAGLPMIARKAVKTWSDQLFVAETQKTRAGTQRAAKVSTKTPLPTSTRPYRFGEFDILAVAMYPLAGRWDRFMYCVAGWLIPDPRDSALVFKYQPVSQSSNTDWTDDFVTAVDRWRSGTRKTISAL
jgi:hypothetical protein